MSALQWRDWSCTVRVVLDDGRSAEAPPALALARRAERIVGELMDDVARSASRFRGDSDLSRINAARGRLVPVRPRTIELVELALQAARQTGGACDPTLGRALVAAGYDADIDHVRARVGRAPQPSPGGDWTRVRVDRDLGRVGVPASLALDLGATAKAWTADEAAARIARKLDIPALVALGGDVAVSDRGPVWPVLVSEVEGGPGEVVGLGRGGIATSSTTGRAWMTATGPAHHLIDPESGGPVSGPYRAVSVLAESCLAANTLSTAGLVWGAAALDRLSPYAARLVDTGGGIVTTRTWPRDRVAA